MRVAREREATARATALARQQQWALLGVNSQSLPGIEAAGQPVVSGSRQGNDFAAIFLIVAVLTFAFALTGLAVQRGAARRAAQQV